MQRFGDRVTAVRLDLSMPRMGGQETLVHLRAQPPQFLQKPFTADDLIGVLRSIAEVTV